MNNNSRLRYKATPKRPLLRFMDDEYCKAFVKEGKVRLSRVENYVDMGNDPRQDDKEGQASFTDSVGVNYSGSEINGAIYILSCSKMVLSRGIKKLHTKFKCKGNFYVEIFQPKILLSKIKKALSEPPILDWLNFTTNINWKDIEYTYGCQTNYDVSDPFFSAHNFQKSPNYQKEMECRLILDGGYRIAEIDSAEYKSWGNIFMPDSCKPSHINLVCGDLSDCVRIKDIRKL